MIRLKRAYEEPTALDGRRILVERLWPRGLSKEKAALDLWLKDMAPSAELRQWFNHQEARWPEFRRRYREELRRRPEELHRLRKLIGQGPVTFVFGSRDQEHNAAVVLKEAVEGGLADEGPPKEGGSGSEGPHKEGGSGSEGPPRERRLKHEDSASPEGVGKARLDRRPRGGPRPDTEEAGRPPVGARRS